MTSTKGVTNLITGKTVVVPLDSDDLTQHAIDKALFDANLYKGKREADYAPLADQLDMQYWDSVHGTRIWLDHIAVVKAKHPKPE